MQPYIPDNVHSLKSFSQRVTSNEAPPLSSEIISQYLTLQGAIAHTDMEISSGPTIILPFSQQYSLGYMAWRNSDFKDFFKKNALDFNRDYFNLYAFI